MLEPDDPVEAKCTECGEKEKVDWIDESIWICLVCGETFSDGTDSGPCFEDDNF